MFITFNKKNFDRFLYISLFLFIISFILIFIISFIQNKTYTPEINNIQESEETLQTSSIPASNKRIILDAGHGLPDGGATSNSGDIIESTLNLEIVLKLQKLLELSNINVILTRSDENGIYNETANTIREMKVSDMENRVQISKEYPADLFISIHMNKLQNTSVKGFQVFYSTTNENNKTCAKYIQENLNNTITEFKNTKQIKEISDIYLTKHINLPFILIECGFLSNNFELNLLQNSEYQDKISWGIYTGIMDYLSNIDK